MNERYITEDGDEYSIELKSGLTDQELDALARKLPTGQLPDDIRELLKFASGFDLEGLNEVTFDGIEEFGMETFFPCTIQLAVDGLGNSWILDIDNKGNWGPVFFACHDPAVIAKHSENLAQFIAHIDDFLKNGEQSNMDLICEKVVMDIWSKDNGFMELETARQSADDTLKNFALSLPDHYVIADLRNKPIQSGFPWGKFGPDIEQARRHETELIWALEKRVKKGLFSRLFG